MKIAHIRLLIAGCLLSLWLASSGLEAKAAPQSAKGRESRMELLQAGPIHVQFRDGELRYLTVGDKEIARRVYFAVRDGNWDTAMPQFSNIHVEKTAKSFAIDLSATCRSATADYSWKGRIVGTPEGVITFEAHGQAGRDFKSNRIGICLLYGAESLAGQAFETQDEAENPAQNTFPELVTPILVAAHFHVLRYVTGDGLKVSASMKGTRFEMEDQRNYGDSSYKAYAPLAYAYPNIKQGDRQSQTFAITVQNVPAAPPVLKAARITLGARMETAKIPKIGTASVETPGVIFMSVNSDRDKVKGMNPLVWGYDPSIHLPDSDNFMDNATTIVHQARTARAFAPDAGLKITPVSFDTAHPKPTRDPRNLSLFGGAWAAKVVKYFALAGIDEADFAVGPGYARAILDEIAPLAGHSLYATTVTANGHPSVEAFAIETADGSTLWIINTSDQPQAATVASVTSGPGKSMRRWNDKTPATSPATSPLSPAPDGALTLELAPYEVVEVRL